MMFVVAIVSFVNNPPASDLRVLNSLHPIRREVEPGPCITYTFRQPMKEIEKVLDPLLNSSTGWEPGGAENLNYVWYHRESWRSPLTSLLSSVGVNSPFLSMKVNLQSETELTICYADGSLILP